MKKFFTITVITALALAVCAQSPQKMSYQCVVRNSAGALVANHAVGMKISILRGSATGTVVFSETFSPNPQTNANGLVTVEIGGGTATVGTFTAIDWAAGPYFLKTETDPAGGTSYTITGTSQLLSVPYAMYAKTAANGFSGAWADVTGKPAFATVATSGSYADLLNKPSLFSGSYNDLTNKPVLFDGTWTSLTGKPVLFDGTWTSLTGKPVLFDGTWTSLSGKPAGFTDGIDNVDDADNSITNEIQALSLSGTVLSLSSGGGSVTLPSSGGGDNWGTQTVVTNTTLTGVGTTASPLAVANTVITPSWSHIQSIPAGFADGTDNIDDADNSITNEIQTINLSGTTLTLSTGGGSVTLPSSGGGDNWGTQTVVTDASLTGNGTTATPLRIADNGVTAAKIASGAVTTAKILDGTVSNADLADNSVTTLKIADGAIATVDLANSTVTTDKLGNLAVSTEKILNGAVTSDKLAANSVTSAKIASGAVTGDKIAQAGATAGQVLKWNSTTWAPAADATGSGSGGWTDDGTIVRLSTTTDSVQMGSVNRLGKLNVGGNIGLNAASNIYFGSDATRISGLTGGDLQFVAEDLSMLTTEDITFGHFGDETWIIFDNANKRVGIGTLAPTDRLHVVQTAASGTGVYSSSTGSNGTGIKGFGVQTGVYGGTIETNSIYSSGVTGSSGSIRGKGVYGYVLRSDGANFGVFGQSLSTEGAGVGGFAEASTGINYGVYGVSWSVSGYGVFGESPKFGVYGKSTGGTGRAVLGEATGTASIGVMGIGTNTNSTGIWGEGANYDFYANGPGTNYGAASSIRWKSNLSCIDNPVDKVMAIRGVYFDWDEEHGGKHDIGLIAEEVGKVLPEIVVYEQNGIDASGLDYSKITPLLVEAIKEQQKQIADQQKEIDELKALVRSLAGDN